VDQSRNREDLLEFEKFMNGIQDKMRRKEEARLAKLLRQKAADGELPPDDQCQWDDSSGSDGSSDDQMSKAKAKKSKK